MTFSSSIPTTGRARAPDPPVHDGLVKQDFTVDNVNGLWVTDITEHRTDEGRRSLRATWEAFSDRVVDYSRPNEGSPLGERRGLRSVLALLQKKILNRKLRQAETRSG